MAPRSKATHLQVSQGLRHIQSVFTGTFDRPTDRSLTSHTNLYRTTSPLLTCEVCDLQEADCLFSVSVSVSASIKSYNLPRITNVTNKGQELRGPETWDNRSIASTLLILAATPRRTLLPAHGQALLLGQGQSPTYGV